MSEEGRERILVVDDDAGMRRTVQRVLDPPYRVTAVAGSAEALERLRAEPYEVALVDVQLDEAGDGYGVCKRIRETRPDTDVILMTGSQSDAEEKLYRSLEEDAFYFLFKPFERRVLRALVERCLRVQRERREKERYARALADDLERARRFQIGLLPRRPLVAAGWRVAGRCTPCEALGGDLYFALEERDGSVVLGVTDVVGHGVSAAMSAGMLRSTIDAARRRDPDPGGMLHELVDGIDFLEAPRYATLFYARLLGDGTVRYVNRAHPPAFVQRIDGGLSMLEATGSLLMRGFPSSPREVRETRLAPGERLVVYSDGVHEARGPEDRELGTEGLRALLRELGAGPPAELVERLAERVARHCGDRPLADDATLLVAERGLSG